MVSVSPAAVEGQDAGSPRKAVAGSLLGMASGALAANIGTAMPCTRTPYGSRCVAVSSVLGGAVGGVGGVLLGAEDGSRLGGRGRSALVGLGLGTLSGLASRRAFDRFSWPDVGMIGLIGGAVGAQPRGALLGTATGGGVGLLVWAIVPDADVSDAVGFMLAGLAAGVLAGWIEDGVEAGRTDPRDGPIPLLSVQVSF